MRQARGARARVANENPVGDGAGHDDGPPAALANAPQGVASGGVNGARSSSRCAPLLERLVGDDVEVSLLLDPELGATVVDFARRSSTRCSTWRPMRATRCSREGG